MTTVPMADTVGPSARYIPTKFTKVAGYRTGGPDVLWTPGDAQRFTTSSMIWVDQSSQLSMYGNGVVEVADIETGAGTIQDFIPAAKNRTAKGLRNTLYCSYDNIGPNLDAIVAADVDMATLQWWVANWNMDQAQASEFVAPHTIAVNGRDYTISIVAVQWASPTSNPDTPVPFSDPVMTLREANIDLSETSPSWYPFVVPKPVVTMTGLVVTGQFQTFKVMSTDNGKNWTEV